jgi:hypothetical protein
MITDAQVTALLTMVEYTARQVVTIRTEVKKIRESLIRHRRIENRVIKLTAEKMQLKQEIAEMLKFK